MSEVADRFRAAISDELGAEQQELLRVAAGTGASRELRRCLHLADRAVRQWAARATAHGRGEPRTAYELLPPLRPAVGHEVQKAANAEQRAGLDAERELIAQMVWGIGGHLAGVDTEAPPMSTQPALNEIAVRAANVLAAAGRVLVDAGWVVDEANQALLDLVAPNGQSDGDP